MAKCIFVGDPIVLGAPLGILVDDLATMKPMLLEGGHGFFLERSLNPKTLKP